jgi:hypothetical protein
MDSILTPIVVLVALTVLMALVMGFVRIPTMSRMGIKPQAAAHTADLTSLLPSKVRQVADNYAHLTEQPTAFYALVVYIHLAGLTDPLSIQLAWAYVVLRVVHTIVQSAFNIVMLRFSIYLIGTLVLATMTVRALLGTFA